LLHRLVAGTLKGELSIGRNVEAIVISSFPEVSEPIGFATVLKPTLPAVISQSNSFLDHTIPVSGPPKVALLVETARGFGRNFLRGVARYSELYGPWDFLIRAGDFEEVVPQIQNWGGTGIIARITSERMARQILKCGLPTIALGLSEEQRRRGSPLAHLNNVGSKPAQIAQMAVEYFRDRCFSQFAYVGVPKRPWSIARETEYVRVLGRRGITPHIYGQGRSSRTRQWEYEQKDMARWISHLPKPIGVLVCNDDRGREVLQACMLAGVRVPEDVAVLGVDNDTVFCELAQPPLSSIELNAEGAGFRAAELLDAMMDGQRISHQEIEVEAVSVVGRRSTEAVAVEDPLLSKALRFIHENRGAPIAVADVIGHVGISRRGLENRFRDSLKRSILDEIQNVRLDESKRLLRDSSLSITYVALSAGFTTTTYFSEFFRLRVGMTPRQYRSKFA
jgi:LacI family transcriptional regulator